MIGAILGDRYELIEKVGEGGMAVVYKAHCRILDRIVAVKILKEEYSGDTIFVEKFKTEAFAAARLSHPNIVNIYDVGQQDDIYYIVMEFVEGQTLKEVICAESPLSVDKAVNIAIMICDGIHHAHEKGIIHKDIKPHNILITNNGMVKVADFGIAQAITSKTVTFGDNVVGSVHYISPEQAKGQPVVPATDIYSLGCVLYEMLTGQIPFDAESPVTVALKHIHDEPVSPRTINDSIPAGLEGTILKALAKNPAHRFATAEQMRNALLNLDSTSLTKYSSQNMNSKTIVMSPLGMEGDDRDLKKKKLRPAGLALIIIAILGLVGGFLWSSGGLFGKEVVVPYIVGMQDKDANKELKGLGLKMNVVGEDFSEEFEANEIMSQNPGKGQTVKEGREIKVIISKGLEMLTVPDVKGKSQSDAELTLRNEGLTRGDIDEQYDSKYESGLVISQNPRAGDEVEKGTSVDLLISKGQRPERVTMPNLIGLDLEKAKAKLEEKNLSAGDIKRQESNEYFKNQVIDQDTAAGVLVDEQTSINLVVSSGPGPVAQTKAIEFTLPDDQDYYKVVIRVIDAREERKVYDQLRKPGEKVVVGISYFGTAKASVELNGSPYQTFTL